MEYNLVRTVEPAVECLSLEDVKEFLRLFDNPNCIGVVTVAPLPPAVYTPATVVSAKIDVLGLSASVIFNVGTVLATGSVILSVEESNDDVTWTTAYTFTTVTPANDVAVYSYAYSGNMRYIRVRAITAVANAAFAVTVNTISGDISDDDLLLSLITLAREYCEDFQNRAYITQTWEMSYPHFPCGVITIPKGKLQIVDSIKYTDSTGAVSTWAITQYVVSARGLMGRVAPAYGVTYPSFVPYPLDAVVIEFTCGYGDAAADVPERAKYAMLVLIKHWYDNRDLIADKNFTAELPWSVKTLLQQDKVVIL